MNTKPKRKYGSIRQGAETSAGTNDAVFDRFFTPEPESLPPDTLVPQTKAPDTKVPQPPVVHILPEPVHAPPVVPDITEVWRTLVRKPGQWTAYPNEISDTVLSLLDVYEQSILQRLYRLSWGHHQETCRVGLDKLAKSCNMSRTKVQKSVDSLLRRGIISRIEYDFGNRIKLERGTVYRVNLPPADLSPQTKVQRTKVPDTLVQDAPNKERVKKEKIKVDSSRCPDCQGTGMWYPEGFDKGVARCDHKRLT